MLLLLEWFNMWRLIFFIYPSFATITINIVELVDENGMLFVQSCMVERFDSSNSLFRGSELDKGEAME